MQPSKPQVTVAEARRWAKAGAMLNPGITFSAVIDEMIYSYQEKPIIEGGHHDTRKATTRHAR